MSKIAHAKNVNRNGFTLIELLIVISIIAVLSTIGMVAYGNFLKSSRDGRRQSDLKFIQSALEEYYADQIYYPMLGSTCSNGALKVDCPLKNPAGTKTYLNKVPTDPLLSNSQYNYQSLPASPTACDNATATKCTSYCLYANLENLSSPKNEDSVNCPFSGNYNLAVTRP